LAQPRVVVFAVTDFAVGFSFLRLIWVYYVIQEVIKKEESRGKTQAAKRDRRKRFSS
jgi:hypothetical protein